MSKALEIPGAILGWHEDKEFFEVANPLGGISASPIYKLYTLWQMVPHLKTMPGVMAEVGVFRGGSAKVICERMKRLKMTTPFLLFDTYEGMPETGEWDDHKEGDFNNTSLNEVKDRLKEYKHCDFIKGKFPDSVEKHHKAHMFKFVHIDVDIYTSVLDCCKWFYPRMVPGGIMLFDDYGTRSCGGAKKAVDEFFSSRTEAVIYSPATQAFVIKH